MGKARRGSPSADEPRKGVTVRLTPQEYQFFKDASDLLNESISLIMRNGATQYIEQKTSLRLSDYSDGEASE